MMSPIEPQALLLDLDGTLADSLGVMRTVYDAFLQAFGVAGSAEEFASLNGPPLREVVRRLSSIHALRGSVEDNFAFYNTLADRAYGEVAPSPGARALLEQAQSAKCVVGVVTANSTGRAVGWLQSAGLRHQIAFVVGAEDVDMAQGKPHPAPYRLAIARSGCAAERVVAVEDSPQGASSACGAGLHTFVLVEGLAHTGEWPLGVEAIGSLLDLSPRLWP